MFIHADGDPMDIDSGVETFRRVTVPLRSRFVSGRVLLVDELVGQFAIEDTLGQDSLIRLYPLVLSLSTLLP